MIWQLCHPGQTPATEQACYMGVAEAADMAVDGAMPQ